MDDEADAHAAGEYQPHDFEPLADQVDRPHSTSGNKEAGTDVDGLAPAILRARFEGSSQVGEWCSCGQFTVVNLTGALEYRCCREVVEAEGKLTFDGSNSISCVTEHGDFKALTTPVVIEQVGPLLKRPDGRSYRRRAGQNLNEYMRAVSFRRLSRWMFGFLGWGNRRVLPACLITISESGVLREKRDHEVDFHTVTAEELNDQLIYAEARPKNSERRTNKTSKECPIGYQ